MGHCGRQHRRLPELKIAITIGFLLIAAQAWGLSPAMLGMSSGPSVIYFGTQADKSTPSGTNVSGVTAKTFMNKNVNFTSPSGTEVYECCAYVKQSSSTNIRLAIYSTDATPALVCQSAEIALTDTSYSWICSSVGSCTIAASTTYNFAITHDGGTNTQFQCDAVTSGDVGYITTDLTGGFSATLAHGSDGTWQPQIICGVWQ